MVRRYQDRIFAVCMKMLHDREAAADLTQDTFVKLIQGVETYDGRSKLSTWLIRIAMNACLSHLRAQKLRKHASLDAGLPQSLIRGVGVRGTEGSLGGGASGREQTPGQGVQLNDQRRLVAAALAGLEPDQRAILILRDVQGLEYEQIAAVLEIAGGTVKSRLFRARVALREALEKLEGPGAVRDR
jgi:RNA polymerase sigma-70 factor (ECF subfamily)